MHAWCVFVCLNRLFNMCCCSLWDLAVRKCVVNKDKSSGSSKRTVVGCKRLPSWFSYFPIKWCKHSLDAVSFNVVHRLSARLVKIQFVPVNAKPCLKGPLLWVCKLCGKWPTVFVKLPVRGLFFLFSLGFTNLLNVFSVQSKQPFLPLYFTPLMAASLQVTPSNGLMSASL